MEQKFNVVGENRCYFLNQCPQISTKQFSKINHEKKKLNFVGKWKGQSYFLEIRMIFL